MKRGIGVSVVGALCAVLLVGCGSSTPMAQKTVTETVAAAAPTTTTVVAQAPTVQTVTVQEPSNTPAQTPTVTTSTTPTTGGFISAPTMQSEIPTTTFEQAASEPHGSGMLPSGVEGNECTNEFVTSSGQPTTDQSAATYEIYAGELSCPEAAGVVRDYLSESGIPYGSSTQPSIRVNVDSMSCGNYWFRSLTQYETPQPYVTCNGGGDTLTFFPLPDADDNAN